MIDIGTIQHLVTAYANARGFFLFVVFPIVIAGYIALALLKSSDS